MNVALSQPDRLIRALSIACGLLTATYVVLVISTIFLASWQSQATSSVRNTESAIGNLEAKYYSTINEVNAMNPATLGYVSPSDIEYVTGSAHPSGANLTFAGK